MTLREKVKHAVMEWKAQGTDRSDNQIVKLSKGKVSGATLTNLQKKEAVVITDTKLMAIARTIGLNLVDKLHWQFRGDNFSTIEAIVNASASKRSDFWIDAPSGSGKTYTFQALKAQNQGTDGAVQIAYIELKEGMSNAYICQHLLADYFSNRKMKELPKQAGKLRQILADKLIENANVLVIDQMEFGMSVSKLKFLHGLWDLVSGKIGVVFCGAHTLPLLVKKGINQEKNYFNQVATRFQSGFRVLNGITPKYIEQVCQAQEITDETAVNWFKYHCKHFRMLAPKVSEALAYASSKGINTDQIDEALLNKMNGRAIATAKTLNLCD